MTQKPVHEDEAHTCPGSLYIAEQTIEQCGTADSAACVLLLAAAVAGLRAGHDAADLANLFMRLQPAAQVMAQADPARRH